MTPDVLPLILIGFGLLTLAGLAVYGWRKRALYHGTVPEPPVSLNSRIRVMRCARGVHRYDCGHQWHDSGGGDAA